MAEGLHHEIGGEAEAGEVLQFVARHRSGRVLRTDGRHLGLAIGTRTNALALGQAAGAANHLLRERETLARILGLRRHAEQRGGRQTKRLAGARGEAAADDQRNAAAGAHFVEDHVRLHLEFGDHGAVLQRLAVVGAQFDDVAHFHLRDVELDRQRARVFHRVVEDRRDLGAQAHAAELLVRHIGNVLAREPQDRVGRRLARRPGADDVADIGHRIALGDQLFELLHRAAHARLVRLDAGARVLQHGERMQRNVGARRGVGRGREIVRIGFARNLEHRQRHRLRHLGARGEPFGVGPGLHHALGGGEALVGQFLHIVEIVEHQKGLLQTLGGDSADVRIGQKLDQRLDVEAAEHGGEQFRRELARHQRIFFLALGDRVQEARLDAGGVVHARRHAMRQKIDQKGLFAGRRLTQEGDQPLGLLGRERQRRNAERGAFGDMSAIGFEQRHVSILLFPRGDDEFRRL